MKEAIEKTAHGNVILRFKRLSSDWRKKKLHIMLKNLFYNSDHESTSMNMEMIFNFFFF